MDAVVFSPIIYAGGKHWLFKTLFPYIDAANITEVVSPFFGGGGLELNLALRGIRIYGYDKFQPVVNFWQHWFQSTAKVVELANATLNLYDRHELHLLKKREYPQICFNGETAAALYYMFNRLGFAGSPSNHIREFALRYDGHYIRDWKNRKNGRRVFPRTEFYEACPPLSVSVQNRDFTESLAQHPDIFAFLDPPYPNLKSRLYGDSRAYHEDFDHHGLFDILKDREHWALTYNDVPFIRDLYFGFHRIPIKHPKNSWRKDNEILIVSPDIAEHFETQQHYLF